MHFCLGKKTWHDEDLGPGTSCIQMERTRLCLPWSPFPADEFGWLPQALVFSLHRAMLL
jgi:hypothetical protein